MAKKIQLQDANGNVLHPLTLGECVTMNNGENLDTLMSKSQMFTPTITQDKSMFKVGTGVDVDYSANVKDGAYESLVFKGKSLVNIHPISYAIGAAGATTYFANKDVDKTKIKSGTRYFLRLLDTDPTVCRAYFKPCDVSAISFANINDKYAIFTTKSVLTDSDFSNNKIHFYTNTGKTLEDVANTKIILCEYQEGMENWDIPYFTGLCDSKMPILRNVGKNLFDVNMTNFTNVTVIPTDGSLIIKKNTHPHYYSQIPIHLKPNTEYTFKCNTYRESDTETYVKLHLGARPHNDSLEYGAYVVPVGDGAFSKTFTTNSLGELYINGYTTTKGIILSNIQLEESSTATSYEDHKTNILRTSEEVVLREVNGVQDTYNALTGEYVKRIGECVLDGSQALSLDGSLVYLELTDRPINDFGIADKMPVITVNQLVTGEFGICMQDRGASGRIYINIEGLTTREEILQHLRTNPITIHYGLVEPVTTIVKPSTTTPFAYQNGHVIVESGFEGQSLLPEIEYSVVTGRTGQVTQNTKVLRKQEQQIIGLEELLLTQVVQMEYERTLLQFDYELQMMMLG